MDKNDVLVIRACLMTEIEACAVEITNRPYVQLNGGFRRFDPREEWGIKLKKALIAVEGLKL